MHVDETVHMDIHTNIANQSSKPLSLVNHVHLHNCALLLSFQRSSLSQDLLSFCHIYSHTLYKGGAGGEAWQWCYTLQCMVDVGNVISNSTNDKSTFTHSDKQVGTFSSTKFRSSCECSSAWWGGLWESASGGRRREQRMVGAEKGWREEGEIRWRERSKVRTRKDGVGESWG